VNEQSVDDYLLKGWKWNEGRYGVQKSIRELVDTLGKVRFPALVRCHVEIQTQSRLTGNGFNRQRHEGKTQQL
jgi:hypothetical protein